MRELLSKISRLPLGDKLMKCNWFTRFIHKRRRDADMKFMYPALQAKAKNEAKFDQAWHIFITSRGQEHWHCECSKSEKEV